MRQSIDWQERSRNPSVASLRKAVRASYHKIPDYNGCEADEIIGLYSERKRLAALGITLPADQIPAYLCDAFLVIESTIDAIQAEAEKKSAAKAKRAR